MQHGLCSTHIMVLSIRVRAAAFVEANAVVVAEDVAGVALAALHASG